jgi:hypothetical protein
MEKLTIILSIANIIILICIPILTWYLNKKTTKEIEKLKIERTLKFKPTKDYLICSIQFLQKKMFQVGHQKIV